jgi:hypothetical protein
VALLGWRLPKRRREFGLVRSDLHLICPVNRKHTKCSLTREREREHERGEEKRRERKKDFAKCMLARLQDSVSCTRFVLRQLVVGKCPEVSRGASPFFFGFLFSPASFFFSSSNFFGSKLWLRNSEIIAKAGFESEDRAVCFFCRLSVFLRRQIH